MKIPPLEYSILNNAPRGLHSWHSLSSFTPYIIVVVVAAIGAFYGLIMSTDISNQLITITPVLFITIGLVLTSYYIRRRNDMLRDTLMEFAVANNLKLQLEQKSFNHQGVMFQAGHDRIIKHAFTIPTSASPIEIGNYQYVIGNGKNSKTAITGYIHAKLPRKLPHILLDATANNHLWVSNLPQAFNTNQILSLEGDFDKYFTLYSPKEYERDALYIFTPDVMLALVQHASNYDIEIVDDNLYLYSSKPFDLLRADAWKHLISLISTISPEFESQTDYYADERVYSRQANIIAPEGQRLTNGIRWKVLLVLILFTSIQILPPLLDFAGANSMLANFILPTVIIAVAGFALYKRRHR